MRISPEQNDQINARMYRMVRSVGVASIASGALGIIISTAGKEKLGLDVDTAFYASTGAVMVTFALAGLALGGFIYETRRYNKTRRGE